ncbi:hypothetical protein BHM03_00023811 [Ensete ventricosum]|uniref:Uncharacterized protein n=1 Tax=Ensete ventricosum TaxID=4639 RepID=A0A445MGQ1_ENSVE|nr:hypothetical protein BHM03_00023811 [Ensete ventricosum]
MLTRETQTWHPSDTSRYFLGGVYAYTTGKGRALFAARRYFYPSLHGDRLPPVTPSAEASQGQSSESPLKNPRVTSCTCRRAQPQEIHMAPLHHEALSRVIQSSWRDFAHPVNLLAGALLLGVNPRRLFDDRNSPSCKPDLTAVPSPDRTGFQSKSAVTGRAGAARLLLDIADSLYRV